MAQEDKRLKKILVASDLSDQAGLALLRGIELGIEHGAEVIIAHVIDETLPVDAQSFLTTTSDHYVRSIISKIPRSDRVTVTIDIIVGRPELDIVERAVIEDADLIVVGLHKRILAENLSIEGTIGEQIIRSTNKPVLIVKNKPKGAYRVAAVGIDFSVYSRAAVRAGAIVAPSADVYLIHAFEDAPNINPLTILREPDVAGKAVAERKRQLEEFVDEEMRQLVSSFEMSLPKRNKLHYRNRRGAPHNVLKREIEALGADLLVMGTHGRVGLARTFAGSVTTDLLNDRLCDVLVIRPY